MLESVRGPLTAGVLALALAGTTLVSGAAAAGSAADEGRQLAFDRKKGNCLSCHAIEGGNLPGNIGPPLVAMQARYPDKAKLRAQIWDATTANPNTMMPPFGRHRILSEDDIDKIAEFAHTL